MYPLIRLFSFLIDKSACEIKIEMAGNVMPAPCLSEPEYLPWIAEALTPAVIVDWMSHVLDPLHGRVERWYLPGSHSLNFLLENALGGGGVASLRIDPQGKAFAQQLLEIQIPVPQSIADQVN